jgi:hypothetical protein
MCGGFDEVVEVEGMDGSNKAGRVVGTTTMEVVDVYGLRSS